MFGTLNLRKTQVSSITSQDKKGKDTRTKIGKGKRIVRFLDFRIVRFSKTWNLQLGTLNYELWTWNFLNSSNLWNSWIRKQNARWKSEDWIGPKRKRGLLDCQIFENCELWTLNLELKKDARDTGSKTQNEKWKMKNGREKKRWFIDFRIFGNFELWT